MKEEVEERHRTDFDPPLKETATIDDFKLAMLGIAGLVRFRYGVERLSNGLHMLAGDRMKELTGKCTTA